MRAFSSVARRAATAAARLPALGGVPLEGWGGLGGLAGLAGLGSGPLSLSALANNLGGLRALAMGGCAQPTGNLGACEFTRGLRRGLDRRQKPPPAGAAQARS